jgi:uncharacterized protein YutE (UPF0331/DUF86 family)
VEYDLDKVRKLSSEIRNALRRLEELKELPEHDFKADPHKVASAKYNLIVAIEGVVDLCHHLIAKNGFRTPEDYSDTFKVMVEVGAIDEAFALELTQMARFRNRLVHIYWDIDDQEIFKILQERLPDIKRFLGCYGAFIKVEGLP